MFAFLRSLFNLDSVPQEPEVLTIDAETQTPPVENEVAYGAETQTPPIETQTPPVESNEVSHGAETQTLPVETNEVAHGAETQSEVLLMI